MSEFFVVVSFPWGFATKIPYVFILHVRVTRSVRLVVLTRYAGALMNLVNIMYLKNGADNLSVVFCNYYGRFCQISQTIAFCPKGVECSEKKPTINFSIL